MNRIFENINKIIAKPENILYSNHSMELL